MALTKEERRLRIKRRIEMGKYIAEIAGKDSVAAVMKSEDCLRDS